ncbi:hypothetical protein ACFWN5_30845 [Streptomyces sp. NPDC058430]
MLTGSGIGIGIGRVRLGGRAAAEASLLEARRWSASWSRAVVRVGSGEPR